ncbi:MAG: FtsX-like permease family protein, partial [Butyricicoccus pullicaecorum]|nr:FtsX-like permease family protein [Butyricicoccus pullicaecorum]
QNHGYQTTSRSEAHYISTGVNWGYTSTQLAENLDPATAIIMIGVLLLILFTGYLIIYNVFQISVTTDIRFYGLLKTIGTTGKQLRRIIRGQVLILSFIAIPIGLILGYLIGAKLTPIIIHRLNGLSANDLSLSPWIFILSALFSLCTVLVSCLKPARMAGKVSAIEAIRYTDGGTQSRKAERHTRGAKLSHMAWANLGRNRKKTVLTITSLSLAVLLLQLTVTFTNGFDMDKYLANKMVSDFVFANSNYFQSSMQLSSETSVPESMLDMLLAQEGIAEGGRVYGLTTPVQEFITEDYFRKSTSYFLDPDQQSQTLAGLEKMPDGRVARNAQLFGMEAFARSKLRVLAGDISTLDTSEHNIAAVYSEDDYGTPLMDSHWAKLGDTITLRHVDSWEYVDDVTGEILDPDNLPDDNSFHARAKSYRDISYTVTALVSVPYPLSYRYFGADEFVLGDQTFIEDTHTASVMLYAFNMKNDAATAEMERFLSSFTQNQDEFDYESKVTYAAEFEGLRSMFLLLGSLLSFIVGLVGILNFFNAILTGIITRRREFAVLQAIGMTGRQLKQMLILEGLLYTLGSLAITLFLSIAGAPLVGSMLSNMFWFFRYRFTIVPILIIFPVFVLLGIALPLISYRLMQKQSIVERIRESD